MDNPVPELKSERLLLRGLKPQDFEIYHRFYSDAEASHFYGGPLPEHLAWRKFAADHGHWILRGYGMWMCEEKASGEMIGACGLFWPQGWPRSELTWWILPEARRKGYALEASRAVIDYAQDVLGWDFVETHMDDENEAARKLALKLGGEVIAREVFPDGVARNVYALKRG